VRWEGKKPASAGFLLAIYSMIYHLNPERFYTNRTYLTQWLLEDTLVITDNDFENCDETLNLLSTHPLKNQVVDITHNPYPDNKIPTNIDPILTNNFEFWLQPKPGVYFFPIFLWMFSLRANLWWPRFVMDAGSNKTQKVMCLNNNTRPHRTYLFEEFQRKNILDQMMYTFANYRVLPGESLENRQMNDGFYGLGHAVYNQYAVNLVTETVIDQSWISEKTCKPFMARQIPIIACGPGVNKFLQDIGLDMFRDIVPWESWDNETNSTVRLQKIADFTEQWVLSGTILDDYYRVLDRVEHNKQYFHSEKFRNKIMIQMDQFKPYTMTSIEQSF